MNIFVTGTGRCGTTTFSKACSHIKNYTSGHETKAGIINRKYPNNHIEVDPRLFWNINKFFDLNNSLDYYIVHLIREPKSCINSIASRKSTKNLWIPFTYQKKNPSKEEIFLASENYYYFVNSTISKVFENCSNYQLFKLENAEEDWYNFWNNIQAKGDYEKALKEFKIKYNASKVRKPK
jgi:hypothetical protein